MFDGRTAGHPDGYSDNDRTGRGEVAVLVARHAVTRAGALAMHPGILQPARDRCDELAWAQLRQAGGEIDQHTRAQLTALDKQITALEAKLPDYMRGPEVPTDAGRAHLITRTDLIDTRRRDELHHVRR